MKARRKVVIWCRNWILYNSLKNDRKRARLWFDVEIEYYTTSDDQRGRCARLWFDVEIEYYTTGLV